MLSEGPIICFGKSSGSSVFTRLTVVCHKLVQREFYAVLFAIQLPLLVWHIRVGSVPIGTGKSHVHKAYGGNRMSRIAFSVLLSLISPSLFMDRWMCKDAVFVNVAPFYPCQLAVA